VKGTIISSVNIGSVNLNVLLAFEALLEEQNVSRAATRIGLSQPAMSNALARLRELFNDPLFIRTSRGMIATSRALELAVPIRDGLAQLRGAFTERPCFDPRVSTRSFRLAMTDYAELSLLAGLLQSLARAGSSSQIVVRRVDRIFQPPEAELRAGSFDAAIGFYPDANSLEPRTRSSNLFAEQNVCIARKRHPLLRKRFTLREFAAAGHVGVFYRDETVGLVDNILAGYGVRRRLVATTPHFLTAVFLVAQSDLIAVVPAGLATRFQRPLGLQIRHPPIPLPTLHMRLLWNENTTVDPALQWFRSVIVQSLARARNR